jgi:hypothetical protein
MLLLTGVVSLTNAGIAPYYSFQLSEGAYLPSKGNWGLSTNLINDIGTIIKFSDAQTILALYELKYSGPGMKRNEGEAFDQRNMGHMFMFQDNWILSKVLTVKIKLNYDTEWVRTGANETWGTGLYDMTMSGGGIDLELKKWNSKILFNIKFNQLTFPNYTDLVEEYKAGSEETSTGKQNNNMVQIGGGFLADKTKITLNYITQDYLKQYIIDTTGAYSKTDKQKESSVILGISRRENVIKNWLAIEPSFTYRLKNSNQSYLYFETINSTPVYMGDYYSYAKITFVFPITFLMTKSKSITFAPEFEFTNYATRPPRDTANTVLTAEKQSNVLTMLNFRYDYKPDDITDVTLFYVYQTQVSNMKFEKYFPYNYSGQYFGIKFSYTY